MSPNVPCGPRPRRGGADDAGLVTPSVSSPDAEFVDSEASLPPRVHRWDGVLMTRSDDAPPARRPVAFVATLLAAFATALALLGSPAVASPVSAGVSHGLGSQATPSWAKAPKQTVILTGRLPRVNAYRYTAGKAPSDRYGVLIHLQNPTPQGLRLVMAGFGEEKGYYLALLDVRPNNTFAWVKASDVTVSKTPYSFEISLSRHTLLLWKGTKVVGSFPVAVGKRSTPTPQGYFFINAIVHNAGPDYGNIIMSTSGFSNVYTTFGPTDGDAAIGIHGTDEENLIGQSVSHGCVRMHTRDATTLSRFAKAGLVVTIQP